MQCRTSHKDARGKRRAASLQLATVFLIRSQKIFLMSLILNSFSLAGRPAFFLWVFVPSCQSTALIRVVQSLSRLVLGQKLPYGVFFSANKHSLTEELKRFGSLADFQQGALADRIRTSISASTSMLKRL